jgi:Mg2+ and Co2+ transporter CorA
MEFLTSFFDCLDNYEFLSSLSSIDFYNKRIHMKSFFWRGLVVVCSAYLKADSKTKKRKVCYMLKSAMMTRLTKVSARALKKFFMHKIHVSVDVFANKLREYLNETTSDEESVNDNESSDSFSSDESDEPSSNLTDQIEEPVQLASSTSRVVDMAAEQAELIGMMQADYNESQPIEESLRGLPDYNNAVYNNSFEGQIQQLKAAEIREQTRNYYDILQRETSATPQLMPMTSDEMAILDRERQESAYQELPEPDDWGHGLDEY